MSCSPITTSFGIAPETQSGKRGRRGERRNPTSALGISAKPTGRAIGGFATRANRAWLRRPAVVADDVFWPETDPRFPACDLSSHSVKAGELSCSQCSFLIGWSSIGRLGILSIRGAHRYSSSLWRRFFACRFGCFSRADAVSRAQFFALDAARYRPHHCTSASVRCEI